MSSWCPARAAWQRSGEPRRTRWTRVVEPAHHYFDLASPPWARRRLRHTEQISAARHCASKGCANRAPQEARGIRQCRAKSEVYQTGTWKSAKRARSHTGTAQLRMPRGFLREACGPRAVYIDLGANWCNTLDLFRIRTTRAFREFLGGETPVWFRNRDL